MQMKLSTIAVCLLVSATASAAPAAGKDRSQGAMELHLNMPSVSLVPTSSRLALGVVAGDPPTTFVLGLGGGFGYFLIDNLELGGELGIAASSQSGNSLFTFDVGPFARYLIPMSRAISFWVEARLGVFYAHTNSGAGRFGSTTSNNAEFRLGASGGVDYNVARSVALYAGVGFDLYMGNVLLVPLGFTYGVRVYL